MAAKSGISLFDIGRLSGVVDEGAAITSSEYAGGAQASLSEFSVSIVIALLHIIALGGEAGGD
jgi:hypothetical protein